MKAEVGNLDSGLLLLVLKRVLFSSRRDIAFDDFGAFDTSIEMLC